MPIQGAVSTSSASTQTLSSADSIYVYTGAGAATWTLPPVAGASGEIFIVYNRSTAATVTLTPAGTDHFYLGGTTATSLALAPRRTFQLLSDGTYWLVVSGGAGAVPLYDNSAMSSEVSVASGVAFTWTQTVGVGNPYGVVAVLAYPGTTPVPGAAAPVVTFGGVTLSSAGWGIGASGRFVWFFSAPNIPAGTQTVSVKLTQSGKTFSGVGASSTYLNAGYVNPIVPTIDNSAQESLQMATIPRNTANPGVVVTAAVGTWPNVYVVPGLIRNSRNATSAQYMASELGTNDAPSAMLPWNIAGSYPVACSGTLAAIELLGAEPTTPHLKDAPSAVASVGSFNYTATAGTYLLVFVNIGAFGSAPSGATYNGVAMTLLGSVGSTMRLYGMANIAGGTKAIALAGGGSSRAMVALSYASVSSVGTAATVTGATTQAVTCSANQLVVQGFGTTDISGMSVPPGGIGFLATASDSDCGSLGVGQCPGSATFISGNATAGGGIAVVLS